jgi:sugar lactone lactonase YvrE
MVMVTGPNAYSTTLSATTKLTGLAPGSYTIVADSIAVPDSIVGSVVDTAHVTGSPATVVIGKDSAASVTYATKKVVGGMWVGRNFHATLPLLSATQLYQSGTLAPADTLFTLLEGTRGLALDAAGNMWVSSGFQDSLAMYSIAARTAGAGTPATAILTSLAIYGSENLSYDSQGNLWVGLCGNHSGTGRVVAPGLLAFSPAQQAAGGVVATPAISITSSGVFKCPHGIVFDGSGNGWVADDSTANLFEFSAAQLSTSGDKAPTATIFGGGLVAAAAAIFDASGNLWVANDGGATVTEYTPAQLAAAGMQTPTVAISLPNGGDAHGLAFDNRGALWVSDYKSDNLYAFAKSQLAASGSPAPITAIYILWPVVQATVPQQPLFDPYVTIAHP